MFGALQTPLSFFDSDHALTRNALPTFISTYHVMLFINIVQISYIEGRRRATWCDIHASDYGSLAHLSSSVISYLLCVMFDFRGNNILVVVLIYLCSYFARGPLNM